MDNSKKDKWLKKLGISNKDVYKMEKELLYEHNVSFVPIENYQSYVCPNDLNENHMMNHSAMNILNNAVKRNKHLEINKYIDLKLTNVKHFDPHLQYKADNIYTRIMKPNCLCYKSTNTDNIKSCIKCKPFYKARALLVRRMFEMCKLSRYDKHPMIHPSLMYRTPDGHIFPKGVGEKVKDNTAQ